MTAVEWLQEAISSKGTFIAVGNEEDELCIEILVLKEILSKAKEMEKQQIIDAYIDIKKEYINRMDCYPPQFIVDEAKQYYNQRFKNE